MSSFVVRSKVAIALIGGLLTFLGIVILVNPGEATLFITTIVGWSVVLFGAGTLLAALVGSRSGSRPTGEIVLGAVQLVVGVAIVMSPGFFVSYLFMLLGIGVIITGIGDVIRANDVRAAGLVVWKVPMTLGIVTLLAGIVMVMAPFTAASFVSLVVAVSLVIAGTTELFDAFML